MATIGVFRTGKGARTTVEGVNLYKSSYDIDYKGDKLDTTNWECLGYDQSLIGIIGCDWSIKGNWATQGQYIDPPGLYPRPDLGQVSIYPSVSDNLPWSFPLNTVMSGKNSAEVRDLVKFEASACTNGSFSAPAA